MHLITQKGVQCFHGKKLRKNMVKFEMFYHPQQVQHN